MHGRTAAAACGAVAAACGAAAAGYAAGRRQAVVPAEPDSGAPRATRHASYGLPWPPGGPVAERRGYAVAYDARFRAPRWVAERVGGGGGGGKGPRADRSLASFRAEPLVPRGLSASPAEYRGSGFDRGHMAPAADFGEQSAMDESFLMGNCAPQHPKLNRGYWARLEAFARALADGPCERLEAVTGPLYLPERARGGRWALRTPVIGHDQHGAGPRVVVPTHFFKVLLCEPRGGGPVATGGVVVPNRRVKASEPLASFVRPLEEIEDAAGVRFFPLLPRGAAAGDGEGEGGGGAVPLCDAVRCTLPRQQHHAAAAAAAAARRKQQ